MTKKLDLNKPVYDLVQEYPELVEIMLELGFTEISKKPILHSLGRVMTIPKGAKMKNIPMMEVISSLLAHGFELAGEFPKGGTETHTMETTIQVGKSAVNRVEQLKSYLERLSAGEDLEEVRADFAREFDEVDASEIMEAEQALLREGKPLDEVQRLCDIHSALFHGVTAEERKSKSNESSAFFQLDPKVQEALARRDSFPKKDYTNKNARAAEMAKIVGHPLYTLTRENSALSDLIESFKGSGDKSLITAIRDLSIHYAKKGDLIYPLLNVKYGISGPSDVMWTVDDEIRDELGTLAREDKRDENWVDRFKAVLLRAEEMIYKEQNILFPICAVNFSQEEWYGIYRDSKDYAVCFGLARERWEEAEQTTKLVSNATDDEIVMPGGHLTLEQLTAILNTIPLEITFVDAADINRFFNEGPKLFKRPSMAIDRDVFSCHPPKIEPMVRKIIDDFRGNHRDEVVVWMEKAGRTMLVKYMAVRNKEGEYLGTLEIVQDMNFAKEHFKKS